MVESTKLLTNALSFTVHPNAIEALERIRDSYKGLSERETLTGADQGVLAAVEMTLKQLVIASGSSRSDAFVLRAVSAYPRSCGPAPRSD
jgi:hypothetical protein